MRKYGFQTLFAILLTTGVLLQGCGGGTNGSTKSDEAPLPVSLQSAKLYLEPLQSYIAISWDAVNGAEYYELGIQKADGEIVTLTFNQDEREYRDYNVNAGEIYSYHLSAFNNKNMVIEEVKSSTKVVNYRSIKSDEAQI